MNILALMIPLALFLGGMGLFAFLWSLASGQYEDLDGAAQRILLDDDLAGREAMEPPSGERPQSPNFLRKAC